VDAATVRGYAAARYLHFELALTPRSSETQAVGTGQEHVQHRPLVENRLLGVVDAGSVDLALADDEPRREEDARLGRWQQQLQRLEYECDLAKRLSSDS
jgi:hypothetical protein